MFMETISYFMAQSIYYSHYFINDLLINGNKHTDL